MSKSTVFYQERDIRRLDSYIETEIVGYTVTI